MVINSVGAVLARDVDMAKAWDIADYFQPMKLGVQYCYKDNGGNINYKTEFVKSESKNNEEVEVVFKSVHWFMQKQFMETYIFDKSGIKLVSIDDKQNNYYVLKMPRKDIAVSWYNEGHDSKMKAYFGECKTLLSSYPDCVVVEEIDKSGGMEKSYFSKNTGLVKAENYSLSAKSGFEKYTLDGYSYLSSIEKSGLGQDASESKATPANVAVETKKSDLCDECTKMFEQKDYEKAMKICKKASRKGCSKADVIIGGIYGTSENKNYEKALEWFRKAAAKDDDNAEFMIGLYYYEGLGVAKNYQEAIQWWKKSVMHENAIAEYDLGVCYEEGYGVNKDSDEALKWYEKSARHGCERANQKIADNKQWPEANSLGVAKPHKTKVGNYWAYDCVDLQVWGLRLKGEDVVLNPKVVQKISASEYLISPVGIDTAVYFLTNARDLKAVDDQFLNTIIATVTGTKSYSNALGINQTVISLRLKAKTQLDNDQEPSKTKEVYNFYDLNAKGLSLVDKKVWGVVEIVQKVNQSDYLVEIPLSNGATAVYYLSGAKSLEAVDGQRVEISAVVTGEKTYQTAMGTSKTVIALKLLPS